MRRETLASENYSQPPWHLTRLILPSWNATVTSRRGSYAAGKYILTTLCRPRIFGTFFPRGELIRARDARARARARRRDTLQRAPANLKCKKLRTRWNYENVVRPPLGCCLTKVFADTVVARRIFSNAGSPLRGLSHPEGTCRQRRPRFPFSHRRLVNNKCYHRLKTGNRRTTSNHRSSLLSAYFYPSPFVDAIRTLVAFVVFEIRSRDLCIIKFRLVRGNSLRNV